MAQFDSNTKVAIVYDWLDTRYGGAEKVLAALHEAFPSAPLFTSLALVNQSDATSSFKINPSFLQKLPLINRKPRYLLPLLPVAFESFDFTDFDVVISVTSAFAKGIVTHANQLHICYLLTPPRYLYSHHEQYLNTFSRQTPIRWLVHQMLRYLTWWDTVAAHRPDTIIPISNLVAERCRIFYQREPESTIYPPVEHLTELPLTLDEQRQVATLPKSYAVVVSRLVSYKRVDLAIQACQKLKIPLMVIGEGEHVTDLKKIAAGNPLIAFWGSQPPAVVNKVVRQAKVLLMPGIEDFGITAAEAVATGIPVIVHRHSGVAELLEDGKTGYLVNDLTVESVTKSLEIAMSRSFQSEYLQKSMRKYATTRFVQQMQDIVLKQSKN